jgi:hypothetical protein
MSLVGKVLVVAQLVFSLLLMAFAGGVSSVQTNWKQQAGKFEKDLKTAQGKAASLTQENQKLQDTRVAMEKSLKDAADKARGEADAARDKVKQLDTQLQQSKTELENMRAEAKISGEEARSRRDEAVSLRAINTQLHEKCDALLSTNRTQADEIVNFKQDAKTMNDKHLQLLDKYGILDKFIRIKGFDADPKEIVGQMTPPPVVEGKVLETKKGGRGGSELVEISLGSDMGLAKGNELYVYRADGKGKYLGKIRLDYVDYMKSVGVVINSTKNGEIKRGDNVTSKL